MMRMFIEMVIVVLLPFVVYGVWGFFGVKSGKRRTIWDRAPFKVLGVIGLSMVIGLIVWQTSYGKSAPYAKYHPAEVIDGKLVPGYFEDPTKGTDKVTKP